MAAGQSPRAGGVPPGLSGGWGRDQPALHLGHRHINVSHRLVTEPTAHAYVSSRVEFSPSLGAPL